MPPLADAVSARDSATDAEMVALHQMAEAYRSLALAAVHELAAVTRERDSARAVARAAREDARQARAELGRYTSAQIGRAA
jgi:hypothetical protein